MNTAPAGIRVKIMVCLALSVLVAAAFLPALNNDFIGIDDPLYVTRNHRVKQGLTWSGAAWAFTTFKASNWHPLTWLSHMADVSLFGLNPSGHHLVNLLLHLANVVILFLLLAALSGAVWRAAAVAVLFGIHPLRVESVAWIAERKDVLATFLALAACWAWLGYLRRRGGAYIAACLLFACALMAKPMPLTLPFVLLLFDAWPLGRHRSAGWRRLVLEKMPLLALAAVSGVITTIAQKQGGMIKPLADWPLWVRAANAPLAYWGYLRRAFWPAGLYIPYPHPGEKISPALAITAALLLAAATAAILASAKRKPYLAVGWFWFLGGIAPVLGLVQVADQAMADRYTYLPLSGIFLAVVWLPADLAAGRSRTGVVPAAAFAVAAAALVSGANIQTALWRDDISLSSHAVAVNPANHMAQANLGAGLANAGRFEEAVSHYQRALAIQPFYPDVQYNLGIIYMSRRDYPRAERHLTMVAALTPRDAEAHINLGVVQARQGRTEEALRHYRFALSLQPDNPEALNNVGASLEDLGRPQEAVTYYEKALWSDPGFAPARTNLERVRRRLASP